MTLTSIADIADPRLAEYRALRDAGFWRSRRLVVAEGALVVGRLVGSPRFRTRSVLLTPAAREGLAGVLAGLPDSTPVYVAPTAVLRGIVGFDFHRGCLAVGERGPDEPLEALVDPPGRRTLLALEDVADPDNVGAIFRNALAFGVDGVLVSAATADPLYRKAIRVSMAATLTVPFARAGDWSVALGRLRAAGYTLVELTPEASALPIGELGASWPLPERVALLVGAEGRGLGPLTRAAADLAVRIAMAPGVDSLNVATATGIALHRLRSARPGAGLSPGGAPRPPA